ncbi:hypothetical protein B0H11DRAFT_1916509 [Mycena galericulata]|nr:hypothetical protein B0H11DRAFT_1916509 [Mycena galericulata]
MLHAVREGPLTGHSHPDRSSSGLGFIRTVRLQRGKGRGKGYLKGMLEALNTSVRTTQMECLESLSWSDSSTPGEVKFGQNPLQGSACGHSIQGLGHLHGSVFRALLWSDSALHSGPILPAHKSSFVVHFQGQLPFLFVAARICQRGEFFRRYYGSYFLCRLAFRVRTTAPSSVMLFRGLRTAAALVLVVRPDVPATYGRLVIRLRLVLHTLSASPASAPQHIPHASSSFMLTRDGSSRLYSCLVHVGDFALLLARTHSRTRRAACCYRDMRASRRSFARLRVWLGPSIGSTAHPLMCRVVFRFQVRQRLRPQAARFRAAVMPFRSERAAWRVSYSSCDPLLLQRADVPSSFRLPHAVCGIGLRLLHLRMWRPPSSVVSLRLGNCFTYTSDIGPLLNRPTIPRPSVPIPSAKGPIRSKRTAEQLQAASQGREARAAGRSAGSGADPRDSEVQPNEEVMDPDEVIMFFWMNTPAAHEWRKREAEDRDSLMEQMSGLGCPVTILEEAFIEYPGSARNKTLQRKEELLDLISDDYTLYNNVIWFDFVESIDGNIHKFGSTDDTDGFEGAKLRARCGYLGPQGAFLIMSTIGRIFAHSFPDLRRRLSRTIDRLIKDRPQDFDSPKPTLLPVIVLPIHHFMEFVLMPHIAARLIAEDMEVSYQQAVDIKNASGDFGEMFHWDLKNTHVQSLDQNNMQAAADECPPPSPERESPRMQRIISVQVFKTKERGWGMRVPQNLVAGQVIGLYTGLLMQVDDFAVGFGITSYSPPLPADKERKEHNVSKFVPLSIIWGLPWGMGKPMGSVTGAWRRGRGPGAKVYLLALYTGKIPGNRRLLTNKGVFICKMVEEGIVVCLFSIGLLLYYSIHPLNIWQDRSHQLLPTCTLLSRHTVDNLPPRAHPPDEHPKKVLYGSLGAKL